jgi:hypothetical protein
MPSNLATKLESLSGYRQMFAPESPEANQNPVAYSHMTVTVGGQRTSVLSRIAAYGTDYSGRTNKLAHHVVPDRSELTPAGPAWLLQQAGLMRTQWDGNCQTTAAGPTVAMGNLTATKCNTWEQLAGDAGWAGALAQAWSQRQSKPIWLVYRLEDQNKLLPLLSEAIALLPESERWKATFNTYATQLPPDVQCRVRCVVDGTQDARMAKARGTVITLGQSNGPAPTNDWSEIARGNQAPAPSPQPTPAQPAAGVGTGKTPPRKSPPTRAPKIPGLPPGKTHAQPALPDMPTAAEGTTPAHPAGSSAEPPAMRPPMTDDPQDYTHGSRGVQVIEPGESPVGTFNQKTKRSKTLLLAAIAAVLIPLIVGVATFALKPDLRASLFASLFTAPAENTDDGSETDEGKDKKETKKKDEGANPDKDKKEEGNPTEKSTPPPLPKLTVAIPEKGNEPVEEGAELTVQVTRDNKESGHGQIITLSNDEKDARVSFERTEIKFSAEEDSKEIKLTIKNDEEFNPAELTITAQFKEDDGKNNKAQAKLLVKDSKDLTIKLMDGESEATELTEGKTYQIEYPESSNAIAPKISYKITSKKGIPAPPQYDLKQKLASLAEEESRLVLNETDEYCFADDFCKLSLVVSYEKNGKVLGKKEIVLPVKDNDPVTRGLRWLTTTVTKLLDESKPNIAANKDKNKQPEIIWETNEWPAPKVEAKTSDLTGETIKLSSRGGQTFPLKTAKKTGQEYIKVKVSEKDSEYDAHLFSNEKSALAYIENPKAPSQPPSGRKIEKEFVAKAIALDAMGQKQKTRFIRVYYLLPNQQLNPTEQKGDIKVFREDNKGDRYSLNLQTVLSKADKRAVATLFKKPNSDITEYKESGIGKGVIEDITVMLVNREDIVLALKLKAGRANKSFDNVCDALVDTKTRIENLMSTQAAKIAEGIVETLEPNAKLKLKNLSQKLYAKFLSGERDRLLSRPLKVKLPPTNKLVNVSQWRLADNETQALDRFNDPRKLQTLLSKTRTEVFSYYHDLGDDLQKWDTLKAKTNALKPQELHKGKKTYFTALHEKNSFKWASEAQDTFIQSTEKQVEALQKNVEFAKTAFNELEKLSFETEHTLVIKIGDREIRQPIAFKIQIK